jgi:hypothetical protein
MNRLSGPAQGLLITITTAAIFWGCVILFVMEALK